MAGLASLISLVIVESFHPFSSQIFFGPHKSVSIGNSTKRGFNSDEYLLSLFIVKSSIDFCAIESVILLASDPLSDSSRRYLSSVNRLKHLPVVVVLIN